MVVVSACLAGLRTRYDGEARPDPEIMRMVDAGEALALCPERLGGLTIPRPPAEIHGFGDGSDVLDGRATVVDQNKREATAEFIRGAQDVLRICRAHGITQAILKDKSPSCGVNCIYKNGVPVQGMGVTAALLVRNGIQVKTRG